MSFKLSVLSTEDQAYVKENANALAAARALSVKIEPVKERGRTVKAGLTSTTKTQAGYEIELQNGGNQNLQNIEIKYTLLHRKDAEKGGGSKVKTTGTLEFESLIRNSGDVQKTKTVELEKYIRKKSSGG